MERSPRDKISSTVIGCAMTPSVWFARIRRIKRSPRRKVAGNGGERRTANASQPMTREGVSVAVSTREGKRERRREIGDAKKREEKGKKKRNERGVSPNMKEKKILNERNGRFISQNHPPQFQNSLHFFYPSNSRQIQTPRIINRQCHRIHEQYHQ